MISIKSKSDIEKMLEAGKIAGHALNVVEQKLRPGMTTKDIDKIVFHEITSHGGIPNFLGLYGFPGSACVSVNEEVIHGIPGNRVINEGDIVSVDLGARYKGWNSDTCYTFPVGQVAPDVKKLLEDTNASLYAGIEKAQVGARLGDISHTIEEYCRERGYGIVQDYCGHGIGKEVHEEPEVPNHGRAGHGTRLIEGMTFCIEPMINMRGDEVHVLPNKWTVVTNNGTWSAHFEHMILITANGPVIMTKR
ncbi:MAG: type I methionyl aminopeptidase [Oscillospiraceae bacterium]|nr:type I methionyl aminopeptidase [Oscillospiraceae bacterium]